MPLTTNTGNPAPCNPPPKPCAQIASIPPASQRRAKFAADTPTSRVVRCAKTADSAKHRAARKAANMVEAAPIRRAAVPVKTRAPSGERAGSQSHRPPAKPEA